MTWLKTALQIPVGGALHYDRLLLSFPFVAFVICLLVVQNSDTWMSIQ